MHITDAILKNFQIHIDRHFKFKPGLNVIIGETGTGKSSIMRSFRLSLNNQPRAGETKYKNRRTKKPIDTTIINNLGNKIILYK